MKYVPALDGLRALAVLTVMAFHARVPGFEGGFFGVDVFFVLSGYLITRLLRDEYERNGEIALRAFYLRRLRRLYPALLLLLIAYLLVAPLVFPQFGFSKHLQDAVISGLYLSDYSRMFDAPLAVLNHTWTLAVEEQFYLLWPIILLHVLRLPERQAVTLIGVMFLMATAWRLWNVLYLDNPWDVYSRFDTHASGLLLGCALGFGRVKINSGWFFVGLSGLIFAMSNFGFGATATATWGFSIAEFSAALMICSRPEWLGASPMAWIGQLSYGLYLWHYPIMKWMRWAYWGWPEIMLVGGGLALVAAGLSFYIVEKRIRYRSPVPLLPVPQPARVG